MKPLAIPRGSDAARVLSIPALPALPLVSLLAVCIASLIAAPLGAQVVISGQVTNAVGVGVAGVDIDLHPAAGGTALALAGDLTGAGGGFSLTVLQGPGFPVYAPGSYLLQLTPPAGFLGESNPVTLTVPASGGTQNVGSFGLVAGWVITGQVVDGDLAGVAGIDIDMRPDGGGGGSALDLTGDTTGPGGNFSLTMPAVTGIYDIFYTPPAPPVPPVGCPPPHLTANPNCTLGVFPLETNGTFIAGNLSLGVIPLENAHCVTGVLVDQAGEPLVGFDVQAFDSATGAALPLTQDDTDCVGYFDVLVPEGTVDLVIRSVDPAPPVAIVPVLFAALLVAAPVDLGTVTAYPGFPVTGTVTRASGTPIADAEIEVLDAATGALVYESSDRTNALGQFTYLVPAGDWLIEVDPPASLVTTVVPRLLPFSVPGTGPVALGTIVLPNGFAVGGRCVSLAQPTLPVPFVDVEFRATATQAPIDALHENAGAAGTFSAMLVPATVDVLLLPPLGSGYAPKVVPSVLVAAPVALGDIPLAAGVSLSGTVTSGGIPVAGAEVIALGATLHDPFTDPSGAFGYQVSPGVYDLTVVPPQGSGDPILELADVPVLANTVLALDLLAPPSPVSGLLCSAAGSTVSLSWSNGAVVAESIVVTRDGATVATLPGSATGFVDSGVSAGGHNYGVAPERAGSPAAPATCQVIVGGTGIFIRGDLDFSGTLTIGDAIVALDYLFGGFSIACLDAADFNDSGAVDISDPIGILSYLFSGGPPPPPPFPIAGSDPTPDPLGCG